MYGLVQENARTRTALVQYTYTAEVVQLYIRTIECTANSLSKTKTKTMNCNWKVGNSLLNRRPYVVMCGIIGTATVLANQCITDKLLYKPMANGNGQISTANSHTGNRLIDFDETRNLEESPEDHLRELPCKI